MRTCAALLAVAMLPAPSHACPDDGTAPAFASANLPAAVSLGQRFVDFLKHHGVCLDLADPIATRVVGDFGAVFTVDAVAAAPPSYAFADEAATLAFQRTLKVVDDKMGRLPVTLQKAAVEALAAARSEAEAAGLALSPASAEASRRDYAKTAELWLSRVRPAVEHWVAAGRLARADGARLLALSPHDQVAEVLRLESKGLWFSKQFDKSILYSVAAPGTSQHLSLLAFDAREHDDARVRAILARHGWFQTVFSDLPHFTFLGRREADLPTLGLVARRNAGRIFWVPDAQKTRGAPPGEPDLVEECPF